MKLTDQRARRALPGHSSRLQDRLGIIEDERHRLPPADREAAISVLSASAVRVSLTGVPLLGRMPLNRV